MRYNDSGDRLPPELLLTANVSLREGGTLYSDLLYAWRGHDDLVSRGHGKVELEPRLRSFYNYYESPRVDAGCGSPACMSPRKATRASRSSLNSSRATSSATI
ncbi:hypothetical protein [Pseudofulvimonas gallinarii]|uniref:hypothetical protein n=1 Tax=Pseudofulvimonas gallinarii TaxID=634155 RepID=UPI0035EBA36B